MRGVIGITAAHLVRQYERPVVLVAVEDGIGRGSARSVPGVDVYAILKSVSHHMESFGGHHRADLKYYLIIFRLLKQNYGKTQFQVLIEHICSCLWMWMPAYLPRI